MIDKIDSKIFSNLLKGGYDRLSSQKEWVNNLNVFPVPDGDTGSNMTLTLKGALSGDGNIVENSLLAARGNSGIILSQFLRGFVRAVNHKEEIDTLDFALAMKEGETAARNAVRNPVEGTILTVMRDISRCAIKSSKREKDFIKVFENIMRVANITLEKTPEMLPVLKDAGVVDAGAQGFVYIIEGMLYSLREFDYENGVVPHISNRLHIWKTLSTIEGIYKMRNLFNLGEGIVKIWQNRPQRMDLAWKRVLWLMKVRKIKTIPALKQFARRLISVWERKIEYKYDVECLVRGKDIQKLLLEEEIAPYGDSILVVTSPSITKVHIHTNEPEKIFEICSKYGELDDKFIEDMEEQQHEFITIKQGVETESHQKVLAIVPGDGFCEIAKSMGAEVIKSLNPSTEEVLKYLNGEDFYFILPCNGDAIPVSEQALKCSKKNGIVIPARTIPEGMSALLAYNPESSTEENEKNMRKAIKNVKTGKVTIACSIWISYGRLIMLKEILFPVLAYFLGSISFAHIIASAKGVSLRETGSGNLGTANVFTNVGKIYGVMVCICDMLKAIVPMFFLKIMGGANFSVAITGLCAIIGHDFPVYYKFRGGKGFSTALGVIGFLSPITLCIAAFGAVITIFFTHYPTLGFLSFLVLTPISFIIRKPDLATFLVVCAALLLLLVKTIPNFKLFFSGGEKKIWV